MPTAKQVMDHLPEPGKDSNQQGFEDLCTRWNREEAEAVEKAKRTLQSPNTTKEQKVRGIEELEYWAIRRGGYDAEIVLIGTLKSQDKDLAGKAHISLKKTWASHFNAWVNSGIINAKVMQENGKVDEAMKVFNKVIFENPLWGEAYHLRAKLYNKLGDVNRTIADLRSTLEYCPNNYVVMVELALTLMDKFQDYKGAHDLFQNAGDLCPVLPIEALLEILYSKAPHLKIEAEAAKLENAFSMEAPPQRLLPEGWIDKFEATERPNQAFLRVGAELEQWFAKLQQQNPTRSQQRKLWGILVIAWDPDKHRRELRSFTTQVHGLLKSRRERELAKARQGEGKTMEVAAEDGHDQDAAAFLRRIRKERKQRRAEAAAAAQAQLQAVS